MNETYSKSLVLMEAVRSILIADTTDTHKTVREIKHYVSQRVYQSHLPNPSVLLPEITLYVDDGPSSLSLSSGTYYLNIKVWVSEDATTPNETLDNITARIEFLLNHKHEDLNGAVSSKSLRCRMIVKESSQKISDPVLKVLTRHIIYYIICDDEIITCP